jgi:Flp pilus assembly protein TadG
MNRSRLTARASGLSSRRGAAVVEFAILLPLLLAVVLGLVEFGRAMMVQQTLVATSREACRVAVLAGTSKTDVIDRATASLGAAGISTFTISMNPDPPSSAAEGTAVTVTIQVSFDNVTWLPVPIYLGGKTLSAAAVMRREWD